jgi:hypothetical protein
MHPNRLIPRPATASGDHTARCRVELTNPVTSEMALGPQSWGQLTMDRSKLYDWLECIHVISGIPRGSASDFLVRYNLPGPRGSVYDVSARISGVS